jgi:hypothetical protein
MKSILEYAQETIPELHIFTSSSELEKLERNLTCMELSLFHHYGTEHQKMESQLDCPTRIQISPEVISANLLQRTIIAHSGESNKSFTAYRKVKRQRRSTRILLLNC